MNNMKEYVNIKDYCTLKVGGKFRYFSLISSVSDLSSLCTIVQSDDKYKDTPIFILGGGSNIVFSDGVLDVIALKMEIKGFEIVNQTDINTDIKICSGEIWDEAVSRTVDLGLSGLELLSAIPGTVGATPVQNVGAYGSEVKDTILEVELYDVKENTSIVFSNADCKFGYRDSIFKNEARGKYIITSVTYRLEKKVPSIPDYPGVSKYLKDMGIDNPTLKDIRNAIINIRKDKLPNPIEVPNVGSFFKNPIVSNTVVDAIKIKHPNLVFFKIDDSSAKIPAGWLIENAGLKGKSFGNVSVYDKNALVLVGNGKACTEDFINTKNEIIKIVNEKFGITLEQEPEMI